MRRSIGTILLSVVGIESVSAHHGLDAYDTTRLLELDGQVVEFRLMDPHSVLVVETVSDNGSVTTWEVEGGSASGIVSAGLTQVFLRNKPLVTVRGFQTKDGLCIKRCRMAGESFDFKRD